MNYIEKMILAYLVNNRAYNVSVSEILTHCADNGVSRNQAFNEIRYMREDGKIVARDGFYQVKE